MQFTVNRWTHRSKYSLLAASLTLPALLVGCAPAPKAADPTPQPSSQAQMRLPVSINEVMVALINEAADPIWVAAWKSPQTEADWRALERRAYQLELGGGLIAIPGTGPLDDEWTSTAEWRDWASQLRQVGSDAVKAVDARDLDAISAVGDRIVVVCEGCHTSYRQDPPTGGKYGELSPTGQVPSKEDGN